MAAGGAAFELQQANAELGKMAWTAEDPEADEYIVNEQFAKILKRLRA